MRTLHKTLGILLSLLLVLTTPTAQADSGHCATVSGNHGTDQADVRFSTGSFGRLEILVPGPSPDGEMGTYHIRVYWSDLKECAEA